MGRESGIMIRDSDLNRIRKNKLEYLPEIIVVCAEKFFLTFI